ncbi:MAG: phosphoenolpyruvate--protein phosphotransferase [Verrucomicrobiota bacterium]|nr:phosphoenolpyruvate--protein phosphotransferase [Verrucomicrobiota bacterium]
MEKEIIFNSSNSERRFQGVGVSQGIAIAHAYVRGDVFIEPDKYSIDSSQKNEEIQRLKNALDETKKQIQNLKEQVRLASGANKEEAIFDAHLLVLEDHEVLDKVKNIILNDGLNVEYAFYDIMGRYIRELKKINDRYLRERVVDIEDVMKRVLVNLSSVEKAEQSATHDHILVIKELTPSDTAQIDHSLVKGFATEVGSYTSHAAIIARSLGLPAVVGIRGLSHQLHTGNTILIDGYEGLVILDPSAETLSNYKHLKKEKNKVLQKLQEARFEDPVTKDGRSITLSANIEFAYEALHAKENGAQGVGLFRTEFFYLNSKGLPDEDTQEQIYSKVSDNLAPDTLIIRTVDIGGDKIPSEDNEIELNPFLGWRGIRISLDRPEMFKTQLRAILRSAHSSSIGIMFPMISTIYELRYAKQLLEEVECDLDNEGIPYGKPREVGAMIEVPSAALLSSQLAKEVDFFSVGTNDLVQYTLAVDRINENVSDLYQPANPAVIKLLDQTVRSGHDEGIWVGVCGEMASDLLLTPLLLGLGFDEFSVGSPQVPAVKYALRKLNYRECKEMAKEAIKCGDEEAVLNLCREIANTTYPEIIN